MATEPSPDASASRVLRPRLDAGLAELGIAADDARREQLLAFVALLARWNRAYNLTAVREPEAMISKHLLDSLAVLPWVQHGPVLDMGTGAGLPGLPLAIMRPELSFTLLDANGKKVRFVRQAMLELGLGNVLPVHARSETYRPQVNFATILARAVAPLAVLCADCPRLVASGGRLLALKGRAPEQEIDALIAAPPAAVRAAEIRVHPLRVPMLDAERCLIEVRLD